MTREDHDRDVFSKRASRKKKEQAIDRVEAAADEQWLRTAHACVVHVARSRRIFSADHVWMELRVRDAGFPEEPRAMGAVFRAAMRERICEPLTQHDTCSRPRRHGGLVRCWKSLIHPEVASPESVKVTLSSTYGQFGKPGTKKSARTKAAKTKATKPKTAKPKAAKPKTAKKTKAAKKTKKTEFRTTRGAAIAARRRTNAARKAKGAR